MRILLIHQYFLEKDDGGGSRFNEMTRIWASQGHEITVMAGMVHYANGKKSSKYKGKWFKKENEFYSGVNVLRCHVSESYNANFIGRLWAYFSFVFSGIWGGLFKLNKIHDVIIATSPPLFVGIIAIVLSFFKRIPFVFEVRDLWPESAIDTGVIKNNYIIKFSYWFEKYLYKKAKLINVLTPAFYKALLEKKGVPEKKMIIIPNAADFSISDNLLETFNSNKFRREIDIENDFVITYVGAHGVANGLDQILNTAEYLKDTNVLFLLIGSGMQKSNLIKKAKEKTLKNVRFLDPVPKKEVLKYILASDMGASVLMKNDTFKTVYSNKTFDYMSCKKPILMAIDGVSRELVEKANAGSFVEPENPEDFEKKIRFYLNNPEKLKVEGENGYKFAKENFDRNVLAKRYIKHVESIITI